MRKFTLVLSLALTMAFSEGCNLGQLMQGVSVNGQPLGSLMAASAQYPGQIPGQFPGAPQQPLGATPGPLDGTVTSGLPQQPLDPGLQTPLTAGLTGNQPQFSPASPSSTPTGTPVDPNALTPQAANGVPTATPLGTGPIDPSTLPTLPAAGVNDNPLALAGTVPQPPGL